MYVKPFKNNEVLKVCEDVLAKYGISVWDYSTDPRFVKKEFFYDQIHMNTKGAELFSKEIASRMKQMGLTEK